MWDNIKEFDDEDREDIENALYDLLFSRNVGLDKVIKFTKYNIDVFGTLTDKTHVEIKITANYQAYANIVVDGKDYTQPFEKMMNDTSGNYNDAKALAKDTFNALMGFKIKFWSGRDDNGEIIWKTAEEIMDAQL